MLHDRARTTVNAAPSAALSIALTLTLALGLASPAAANPGVGALQGYTIAVSAGHGINPDGGSWAWQRGITENLREDIHTNQTVIEFLIPMMERAGARVVTARERSYGTPEVLLDSDDPGTYEEIGDWTTSGSPGFAGGTYRFAPVTVDGDAEAWFRFTPTASGPMPVYAYWLASDNRNPATTWRIEHAAGVDEVTSDQSTLHVESWSPAGSLSSNPPPTWEPGSNNERWHYLGTWPFAADVEAAIVLTSQGDDTDRFVIADAVRVGAWASGVTAGGAESGFVRWQEAALAHMEAMGYPGWMLGGDVTTRPYMALYERVDAYFALHTNCCEAQGTSTYTWYPEMWVNKSSWPAGWESGNVPEGNGPWADSIHESIVDRMRATWDPSWSDRGRKGANFGELRPQRSAFYNDLLAGVDPPTAIPSVLVEAAFHDTLEDAVNIRELTWRFELARAVRNGMIRGLTGQVLATVPPLAPEAIAATSHADGVEISWLPNPDEAEVDADPTSWRVYASVDGIVFSDEPAAVVPASGAGATLSVVVDVPMCDALYVRVTGANDAGESMDSATVGARRGNPAALPPIVLWVDGVDREVRTVQDPTDPRDYARIYGPAITAAHGGDGFFAMATDDAVAAGLVALGEFAAVAWSTGETSTADGSLLPDERVAIEAYLADGPGRVLLSGAEIGWDLVDWASGGSESFLPDVLHAVYTGDSAGSNGVIAPAGSALAGLPVVGIGPLTYGDCSFDAQCIEWADTYEAGSGGTRLLDYEGTTEAAATFWEGSDDAAIVAGFPVETITDPLAREEMIAAMLELLTPESAGLDPPLCDDTDPPADPGPETEADAGGTDQDGGGPDEDAKGEDGGLDGHEHDPPDGDLVDGGTEIDVAEPGPTPGGPPVVAPVRTRTTDFVRTLEDGGCSSASSASSGQPGTEWLVLCSLLAAMFVRRWTCRG